VMVSSQQMRSHATLLLLHGCAWQASAFSHGVYKHAVASTSSAHDGRLTGMAAHTTRHVAAEAAIRTSGLEDEYERRWKREQMRRRISMNLAEFFSDPFEVLSTRIRNAPVRWRGRLDWLRTLSSELLRGDWEHTGPLPEGWLEFLDSESGEMYYVSPEGVSTWKRPPPDSFALETVPDVEDVQAAPAAEAPLGGGATAARDRMPSLRRRAPTTRTSSELRDTSLANEFRKTTGVADDDGTDAAGGSASSPAASKTGGTSVSMADRFRQQRLSQRPKGESGKA
jgi:hypothetical protein